MMCGICGFWDMKDSLDIESLEKMNQAIVRRGPDDDGFFFENKVGLAMRRLAIQDIEGGKQPIFNENKSVVVVFNGEIYNFEELRESLIGKGHSFSTRTDTEVLVHLYEEYGMDFLKELRGMFAFALYDRRRETLYVVRDRLGIKPLFYSKSDNFIFGSEIKCILKSEDLERVLDYQALDAFLAFGYIPAPLTIYDGIAKLEPGHYLEVHGNTVIKHQYWDLSFPSTPENLNNESLKQQLESELINAIESHLVSDVEVGAFLSGGIDSSLVASIMQESMSQPLTTFTAGFSGRSIHLSDERKSARSLSQKYYFNSYQFEVSPNFIDISKDLLEAFDEPFSDDSIIPTYYLCLETSKRVKVAVSGLGGDELFGGYNRYAGVLLSQKMDFIPKILINRVLGPLIERLPEFKNGGAFVDHLKRFVRNLSKSPAERYLGYLSSCNSGERRSLYSSKALKKINFAKTDALIVDHFNRCQSKNDFDKVIYTDIKTYLPEDILALSDRLSMYHSLELRVPLVDHRLVEFSTFIPNNEKITLREKKILLKKIASRWVPQNIITNRKQGFEAPMAGWLKNELKSVMLNLLSPESLNKHRLFDQGFVDRVVSEHLSGKQKNNKLIFGLMVFQIWFDGQSELRI